MESAGVGGVNGVPTAGGCGGNNSGSSDSNLPLKNAEQAQMDRAKFYKYSMDPNNPKSQGKWKAFEDVGYNVHTLEGRSKGAQDVMAQIEDQLPQSSAKFSGDSLFGTRYQVNIQITGPNGRTGTLVTTWQYDVGSDVPRLITNWLQVHK